MFRRALTLWLLLVSAAGSCYAQAPPRAPAGFRSEVRPGELLIDDRNATAIAREHPEGRGRQARDWTVMPYGEHPVARPFDLQPIARSQWTDLIAEMEANESRLSDHILAENIPSLNQQRTNYCWTNGVVSCLIAMRCSEGSPYIELSPASVAAPIKNYRNEGGWGGDALEYIVETGICTTRFWPANAIDRRYNTPESLADKARHRTTDWYELKARDFDQLMTCLLLRIPVAVGYNWWGHEVAAIDPVVISPGKYGIRIRNSWGDDWGHKGFSILTESKARPDDAVAPVVSLPSLTRPRRAEPSPSDNSFISEPDYATAA